MQIDVKSIFDSDANVKLTNSIDYPKCSFGFHHYIHSLKKDTEVIKQFENKKKVYLVTNKFEVEVDKYDNSIKNETNKFLSIADKTIISNDFYKLWEIMFMFDLFDINLPIKSAHFLEDGSNIQSLSYFREKFSKDAKTDKYFISKQKENIKTEDGRSQLGNNKKIVETDLVNTKEKIDFITIGSGFGYHDDNENIIEQEYHVPCLENIINAVKIQKKGGSLVIKIFETFTDVNAKIFSILISLYDRVFIIKPMTSVPSTSEKYLVCSGFKYSDTTGIAKKLDSIYSVVQKNQKLKLCDLFIDHHIDRKLRVRIIKMNELVSNQLFKSLGEIVNFINAQDYYGDTYEKYRDEQINANNFWVETFLPDPKNYKETKKRITDASFLTNKINVDDAINLERKIQ